MQFALASILYVSQVVNKTSSLSSSCTKQFLSLAMRNLRRSNRSATRFQQQTDFGYHFGKPWEGKVVGKVQFYFIRVQQVSILLLWLCLLFFFTQKIFFLSIKVLLNWWINLPGAPTSHSLEQDWNIHYTGFISSLRDLHWRVLLKAMHVLNILFITSFNWEQELDAKSF